MSEHVPLPAVELRALLDKANGRRDHMLLEAGRLKADLDSCEESVVSLNYLIGALHETLSAHVILGKVMERMPATIETLLQDGVATAAATQVEQIAAPVVDDLSAEEELAPEPEPEPEPVTSTADELTPSDNAVLLVLRANVDAEGVCHLSAAKIADQSGISLSALRSRTMPVLKERRLLESVNRSGIWSYRVAPKGETLDVRVAEPDEAEPVPGPAPAAKPADEAPAARRATEMKPDKTRDRLLELLTRAAEREPAILAVETLAKKFDTTELRIQSMLTELANAGEIVRHSCTFKGHVRVGLPDGGEAAS